MQPRMKGTGMTKRNELHPMLGVGADGDKRVFLPNDIGDPLKRTIQTTSFPLWMHSKISWET